MFEATINRDELVRGIEAGGLDEEFDPRKPMDDGNPIGTPEAELSLRVDVSGYLAEKRAALGAHASQVTDTAWVREMSDEDFAMAFAVEWFIEPGAPTGVRDGFVL